MKIQGALQHFMRALDSEPSSSDVTNLNKIYSDLFLIWS